MDRIPTDMDRVATREKASFYWRLLIAMLSLIFTIGLAPKSLGAEVEDSDISLGEDLSPLGQHEDVLVCGGGWRFPLYETRREAGPARLSRLLEIQRDIVLSQRAYGFCDSLSLAVEPNPSSGLATGACAGLLSASRGIDRVSESLFGRDAASGSCLGLSTRESGQCEHFREQLTILRRYQRLGVQRAALVASQEVCLSQERLSNRALRNKCSALRDSVVAESSEQGGPLGRFGLSAPLPKAVAKAVENVERVTDGHFLDLVSEDYLGVQEEVCGRSPGRSEDNVWSQGWERVRHSLCAELSVASRNADTCRQADLYIDERGQLHSRRDLTTRAQRREATLCIDVSDFDADHPLMVTLGISPKSSIPERVWPGETVMVGALIDQTVGDQDVLQIRVFGKARGVSLKEVLRVNGASVGSAANSGANAEACRIARSWVPVVDHELPVGSSEMQAVIPVSYGRGRDGASPSVREGQQLLVWVRNIEPAGAVLVEYADGRSVRYEPPPLLGESRAAHPEGGDHPGQHIGGASVSVSESLLPRRARYPGSRVLRLGAPKGNSEYAIRICARSRSRDAALSGGEQSCSDASLIVNERLFVHGSSHMGIQLHVGYSFFRTQTLVARRTAAARAAGSDLFEVVEKEDGRASQDIAVLLSVYPFGRDPYDFSARPWRASFWHHAALLVGFSVRKSNFWEDVYLGASLPLANGISATLLGHFARRDVPTQTQEGQFLRIEAEQDSIPLRDFVGVRRNLSVGVGVGISFDLNLFQRAFGNVWQRISGPRQRSY